LIYQSTNATVPPKAFLDVHDEGWERRLGKRQHDA
jgi:hypothetical protein